MDKFTELCLKYHTPKVCIPGNDLTHDYAPHYNRIFSKIRPVRKVLEIGLGYDCLFHDLYRHGDSLRIWAELFPEAAIYGLDIREDALLSEGRIISFQCDQSNRGQLEKIAAVIGDGFDLIVDDGSHKTADQIQTAEVFAPRLSDRGVYVIEDVLYPEELEAGLEAGLVFKYEMIECSRAVTMGDDRLCVIERKS